MCTTIFQQKEPNCLIYRTLRMRISKVIFRKLYRAARAKKKKVLQGSEKPHMNKNFRQVIMKRSKLKNKANKTKNLFDIMNCKKQRNDMTKLNKTAKLEYLNNFKLGKDNKLFWKK